jgi:hypothetical protein
VLFLDGDHFALTLVVGPTIPIALSYIDDRRTQTIMVVAELPPIISQRSAIVALDRDVSELTFLVSCMSRQNERW